MRTMLFSMIVALVGCGGGGGTVDRFDARATDAGIIDAPTTPTDDASCFTNPTTHHELINACTDAQPMAKDPTLPLLADDGGLPPLPQ